MKKFSRVLGLFLCIALALSLSVTAFAAQTSTIDVTEINKGYFTVSYDDPANVKMKVGVTYNGKTNYLDYAANTDARYSVTGDGAYTITLYRNISGNAYSTVTGVTVNVQLEDKLLPYLVSTTEVTFSEGDAVSTKAAELCEGLTETKDKAMAIYNYIAGTYKYDFMFAYAVMKGSVTTYIPNTVELMEKNRGVCIDFSALFAAMCRSQGIACAVATGYIPNGYHAWNMLWVDEQWVAIDMTNAITKRVKNVTSFETCVVSLENYSNYSF